MSEDFKDNIQTCRISVHLQKILESDSLIAVHSYAPESPPAFWCCMTRIQNVSSVYC